MIYPFLRKFLTFLLLLPLVVGIAHFSVGYYLNGRTSDNAYFIWGDSQTYFGIDLVNLQELSKKRTNSAAFQGASIYDFLVFSKRVPDNSNVVISISKLSQIQWKRHERNSSDFSISGLTKLYNANYSLEQLFSIVKKNKRPKNLYIKNENSFLYPHLDSLTLSLPVGHFEKYYEKIPEYIDEKQKLFLEGIKTLKSKNSKITFIEFPYHPILQKIELESPIYPRTQQFKQDIAALFEEFKFDTIRINDKENMMYDLSHLNKFGAEEFSTEVTTKLSQQKKTTMYIVEWRNQLNISENFAR